MNTDTQRDALKAQLLDSIRIKELSAGHPLMKPAFEIRERELRAQIEALEYADKLAQGLPDGMLPKDIEVLREANCGLAMELTAVTEQRDRLAEALDRITISGCGILCRQIATEALQSLTTND